MAHVAKNDYFAIDGPFRESIAHSGWVPEFYPDSNYASGLPVIPGETLCRRTYHIGHTMCWIYNFVGIMIGSLYPNFWLCGDVGSVRGWWCITINTIGYLDKENTSSASSLVHWFFLDSQMISMWWQDSSHMTLKIRGHCLIAKPVTLRLYSELRKTQAFFRFIN